MVEDFQRVQILLSKIRSSKEQRDEVLVSLFNDQKLRNGFKSMISKQNWPTSIFDQIFDIALIKFVTTVIRRYDFELKSDLNNYIIVIGKNYYLQELKSKKNHANVDDFKEDWQDEDKPDELMVKMEQKGQIQKLLGHLGKNCKEVLMYWANSYSMIEIAKLMGYQSDMMARKKKYKCLKELTLFVESNPTIKELLKS